jgi:ArsR family transcriptional regulator, arsenate/arsenite/antimonite-responsive transcriptional repressor / arsenate reductase (thioredoxin)
VFGVTKENLTLEERAARHGALSDPIRLAIVDELVRSDRSPVELRRLFDIESNLLAHHLDTLESVGMIQRSPSSGDGRRRYVRLIRATLPGLIPRDSLATTKALFLCSANSARSQLAAALWRNLAGVAAESAGTHPAPRIHPGARAAAKRIGLDLGDRVPQSLAALEAIEALPSLVITVCDQAHEEIEVGANWLHWSIVDPVSNGTKSAFDATVSELRERISALLPTPPLSVITPSKQSKERKHA